MVLGRVSVLRVKGFQHVLVSLAGLASWAASVVPRARPWVSHLYGALSDTRHAVAPVRAGTRVRPKDLLFVRRFEHAAAWLLALLASEQRICRKFSVAMRQAEVQFVLRTDASPFGMGGILFTPGGTVLGYWADALSEHDLAHFKATKGDPAWQSEWEFLAVVVSFAVFVHFLGKAKVKVQTDNSANIAAAMKLSSPKPLMNALAGELSLRLEVLQGHLEFMEHIPGLMNVIADALSRLEAGKSLPPSLMTARRFPAPSRTGNFYIAWPQSWR